MNEKSDLWNTQPHTYIIKMRDSHLPTLPNKGGVLEDSENSTPGFEDREQNKKQ